MTVEDEPKPERKRKTLLERYEIPITHLDFKYIEKCKNVVEVERIVRILRSNEEGHYPDLLKCAEDRLRCLSPENRLLRVVEPVITKNLLNPEEWKSVEEDLLLWKDEVDNIENRLSSNKNIPEPSNLYPDVRRSKKKISSSSESKETETKKKESRISATDYRKWDMFDADSECMKMDIAEEKRQEDKLKMEVDEKRKMKSDPPLSLEETEIRAIADTADNLCLEERKILAVKEKDLGNEFYQTNRLDQALRHYTRSIYLHPTAAGYNNRAATYLKQCRFSKALDDLNIVIEMEPDNVKARYRRALSYQHKNEFQKALEDISVVLKHEPKHVLARHVADQLRENCASLPQKHRIKVKDDKDPRKLVIKELTEEEIKRDYKDKDYLEVNDQGLPKIMCNCNGKYTYDPIMKSNDPVRLQHIRERYGERSAETMVELDRVGVSSKRVMPMSARAGDDPMLSNSNSKRNKPLIEPATQGSGNGVLFGGAKRIEIVELEKIEEEDSSPNKEPLNPKDYPYGKNENNKMATDTSTTCLVSDLRSSKPKKVYFGGFQEEEELAEETENSAVVKPCNGESTISPATNNQTLSLNVSKEGDKREMCDFRGGGDSMTSNCIPEVISNKLPINNIGCWNTPAMQTSIEKFPTYIDSDDDEFPDDENSSDLVVDIHQVEKIMDNDVDTISKDLFPDENLEKCECGEGYKLKSFLFETKWQALEKSPNSLEDRGRLIRLVCPHQLSSAIGTTLSDSLLTGFFTCLNDHFDPETEKDKIVSYLQSISTLPRFRIISSFIIGSKEKKVINDLLKKIQPLESGIEIPFFENTQ